jgi:hypothetical protein
MMSTPLYDDLVASLTGGIPAPAGSPSTPTSTPSWRRVRRPIRPAGGPNDREIVAS